MIQKLILKLIELLETTLADKLPNPSQHIQTAGGSPAIDTLPLITLFPGDFTVVTQPGDGPMAEPTPQELRQKLAVSPTSPAGPYLLTKTPLLRSVRCKVFFEEGNLSERQVWLQEPQDFTIDYATRQCSFSYDLTDADSILFIYSFVSVATLRGFIQDLFIDIAATSLGEMEQLASLIAGTILTHQSALITACNQDPSHITVYDSGGVSTQHQLSQIQFLEGKLEVAASSKTQLRFSVAGQIRATREITEGFGLIEKIHSPGRLSDQAIDIAVEVD